MTGASQRCWSGIPGFHSLMPVRYSSVGFALPPAVSSLPIVVDLDPVALHPAVDLHARLAELAPDRRDVAAVLLEQRPELDVARDRAARRGHDAAAAARRGAGPSAGGAAF